MKQSLTFKKGQTISDAYKFAVEAIETVLGDDVPHYKSAVIKPDDKFPRAVRVTVETFESTFSVFSVLSGLGLSSVEPKVEEFVDYRRDELRKPIRSDKALRRLLMRFKGEPSELKRSIEESMSQGWTGLFVRGSSRHRAIRSINTEGKSDGGEW